MIKGDNKEKSVNLSISKSISKEQIFNLHQVFDQHLTSKTDRKGKHQMFKTLITFGVINTIHITLITSAINVIWIVLIAPDVINRNCHNLLNNIWCYQYWLAYLSNIWCY